MNSGPSKPIIDGSAPDWAARYASDMGRYIDALLSRIKALEARIKTLEAP